MAPKRPSLNSSTRSHNGWRWAGSWDAMTTAAPASRRVVTSVSRTARPARSKHDAGSSSKSRPGAIAWAIANATRALAPLVAKGAGVCAIVAKTGDAGKLDEILASHPRIHTAEGCFYRDVVRQACSVPVRLFAPSSLDTSKVAKLAGPPWGKDQKLAALAAWSAIAE